MKTSLTMAALAVLAGCGGAPRRTESLMESVMTYNDGVRWERLPVAASRVPPAEREDFIDERDQLAEDLKITDWEVVRVRSDERGAKVHVKYTWYEEEIGTVHETHALQRWRPLGQAWVIIAEHRLRGEEMPGLPEEPAEDAAAGAEADGATEGAESAADDPGPAAGRAADGPTAAAARDANGGARRGGRPAADVPGDEP